MTDTKFTVLDLFCGAGGLSLGFQRAGFTIVRAIDNNLKAVQTYAHNVGEHVLQSNLAVTMEALVPAQVIVGGPHCQGFSSAGLRQADDQRNTLEDSPK